MLPGSTGVLHQRPPVKRWPDWFFVPLCTQHNDRTNAGPVMPTNEGQICGHAGSNDTMQDALAVWLKPKKCDCDDQADLACLRAPRTRMSRYVCVGCPSEAMRNHGLCIPALVHGRKPKMARCESLTVKLCKVNRDLDRALRSVEPGAGEITPAQQVRHRKSHRKGAPKLCRETRVTQNGGPPSGGAVDVVGMLWAYEQDRCVASAQASSASESIMPRRSPGDCQGDRQHRFH